MYGSYNSTPFTLTDIFLPEKHTAHEIEQTEEKINRTKAHIHTHFDGLKLGWESGENGLGTLHCEDMKIFV